MPSIRKVEVWVDYTLAGEADIGLPRFDVFRVFRKYENKNAGFRWKWNTAEYDDGTHDLMVIAYDSAGAFGYLGKLSVTILNEKR